MKRLISLLLVAAVITAVFSGCSLKKSDGETFIMPVSATPESLDPQISNADVEKLIIANCFEGLVRIASNGSIENGVATNYTVSSDGLKYTFYLREDAKWHSLSGYDKVLGEGFEDTFDFSVKAQDFAFGLKRALDPQTGCKEASKLFAIKNARKFNSSKASADELGLRVINDYALEITLEYRDDEFLYALTSAAAMPCNEAFWSATAGKYGLSVTYTICNGPFYLSEWNDDQNVRMTNNPDYSGENEVKPYSVRLIVNNDAQDIKEKTLSGTYDAGFFSESALYGSDRSMITSQPLENTVCSLVFNCSDECFKYPSLRKAICLSSQIDKSALPVNVSSLASGIIPPFCSYNGENYRVKAGKAVLSSYSAKSAVKSFEKGLEKLGTDSIKFNVLCCEEYEETVRALIQLWQKTLGIKLVASVDVKKEDELLSLVRNGEFSVAFYPLEAKQQDARSFLTSFTSQSGDNILNFSDKNYDKLVLASAKENSVESLLQCENYLLENAVIFPVFNQNSYFVTSAQTSGIYFALNRQNVFFINAERVK